jgi:succinoglycan biosynthesis protein ExoA
VTYHFELDMVSFPLISIIMPVRNEAAFIARSLDVLFAQDYPAELMEFLIGDGMSSDNTRSIIAHFTDLHPEVKIQILDNPSQIVPTAMNLALRRAKGDIIIRVDGHTIIAPDYVRQCVEALQRTNADNVGGKMNAIGKNPFGKAVALATSTPFGVGGARFHYSDTEERVDTVYMGAWPRRIFEKIGLFDEELVRNQDDEFNYRLREHGGKILLCPQIKSEYSVRSTPRALWRQYYQYGFWKVRVLQKHPRQMSLRQFVPPSFVAALFGSVFLLFLPFPSFILYPLSFVPLAYFVANVFASLYTASKRDWQSLSYLPFIFAILHISYGLGFLVGLLKFAGRWGDKQGQTPAFGDR